MYLENPKGAGFNNPMNMGYDKYLKLYQDSKPVSSYVQFNSFTRLQ